MSGDFIEVSWRSGLGAGSREAESETKKKGGRKPAQEETRRGRAVAMRVLAAVRALRLRGS